MNMDDARKEIEDRARKAARRARSLRQLGFTQTPTQMELDTAIIERTEAILKKLLDLEMRVGVLEIGVVWKEE